MTDQEKLERINVVRQEMGQEPLTALPGATKQPDAQGGDKAPDAANKPADVPPAPVKLELNDDVVKKYLEEKGIKVESFDDFKPKPKELTVEEKEQQRQDREAKKLSFGIERGYYKKEDYDNYVHASKSKADLVYADYKEAALADDPELTEFDIQDEFQAKFGLNAEKNTRQYKQGQKQLEIIADKLLHTKYEGVFKSSPDFDAWEATEKEAAAYRQKIENLAPQYKRDVEDVANELKKITHHIKENDEDVNGVEIEFDFSEKDINEAKKILLRTDFSETQIASGWDKSKLKDILNTALIRNSLPKIVTHTARNYANAQLRAKQKERQGVVPQRDLQIKNQIDFNNSEADRRREQFRGELGIPAQSQQN